jgi:hypothetical protein
MDVVIPVLIFLGSFLLAYFIFKESRRRDENALDEEIDQDFTEEFDLPESPSSDLSPESMEKVVDWLEDDLRDNQPKSGDKQLNETEDIV